MTTTPFPPSAADGRENGASARPPAEQSRPPSSPDPAPWPDCPPMRMAAESISRCLLPYDKAVTAASMRALLEDALAADGPDDDILFYQAQVLDALFHRLAVSALTAPTWNKGNNPDYLDDSRVFLALRAQKQCRVTLETLRTLKKEKTTNEMKDIENA